MMVTRSSTVVKPGWRARGARMARRSSRMQPDILAGRFVSILLGAAAPDHRGALGAQAVFHAGRISRVVLAAIHQDLDLVVAGEGAQQVAEEVGLLLGDQDQPLGG